MTADSEKRRELLLACPTNQMLALEMIHIREVMDLKEEALKLQAGEYERRLSTLNHEAERLDRMQAMYWPREVAEKYMDSQAKVVDGQNGRISAVEKSLWRISGALAIIYIAIQFLERFKLI